MNNFDREFNRTRKTVGLMMVFNMLVTLAVLGFLAWVIVKVLAHFGIL